jgi:hypothetical protein
MPPKQKRGTKRGKGARSRVEEEEEGVTEPPVPALDLEESEVGSEASEEEGASPRGAAPRGRGRGGAAPRGAAPRGRGTTRGTTRQRQAARTTGAAAPRAPAAPQAADEEPPPPPRERGQRAPPTVLSEEHKENVVEWVQANPCMFNKGESISLFYLYY